MIQEMLLAALPLLTMLSVNNQATVNPHTFINPQNLSYTSKQETVWTVKENDTLTSIASNYYGSEEQAALILKDNPLIKNPNVIEKGWKLKLRHRVLGPKDLSDLNSADKEKSRLVLAVNTYSVKTRVTAKPKTVITNNSIKLIKEPVTSSTYDNVYKEAGEKFGVPWQVLYGLHLTETGQRDGTILNHQGSGARGPMQFMPQTFRAYAVDGDGDGVTNIDDAKDAIYTAANFLAKHGSLDNGLKSYGGNTAGTLAAAKSKGLSL